MAAKNTGRGRGTTRPSPPDAALDGFGPEGASVRHAGRWDLVTSQSTYGALRPRGGM